MTASFSFDPLRPEVRRDPYALYAEGRRSHPAYVHEGVPLRVVSIFGYEDTQSILRDHETWSSCFPLVGLDESVRKNMPPPSMLGTDPPEHTRLRSLVNKAFTPRIIHAIEPRMIEVANALLDDALDARDVDLTQALTYPLPVVAIAELIGIPSEDRAKFKRWSDEAIASLGLVFLGGLDPERVKRQAVLLEEMRDYFVPLAEARRAHPQDDLLTGLVQAEHEGSRLDYSEMLSMLTLLLVAGNETTTTLIGNAAIELMAHPEAARALREDPALLPGAIEEVLRFASPVQFDPRRATRKLTLHGVEIDEDDYVLCWIGSANRDAKVFERPEVFDITREKNPHLSFGFGTHFCLGANLARLEARVALGTLLGRTRSMERRDDDALPLHPSPVFRGVTRLPMRLEPR